MNEIVNVVGRHEKLPFAGVKGTDDSYVFHHLYGFTELSESKNPKEYNRKYIDEKFERSDVVGYSPSMSYAFDEFSGDEIQRIIIDITDNEKIGAAAVIPLLVVDTTRESKTAGAYEARMRYFTVVPDSAGDDENVYTYSGELKANGESVFGTATTTDGWETCTFTEDTDA